MPYDGRRTITVLFAFTIIIHSGSGVCRTSSSGICKYRQGFFSVGSHPDANLKGATDPENSPGGEKRKNHAQRSAEEKTGTSFVDRCRVFCGDAHLQKSDNLKREMKLLRAPETLGPTVPKKFHTREDGYRESIESKRKFLKHSRHSINTVLWFQPPNEETYEKERENFKVNRAVGGDAGRLRRETRNASGGWRNRKKVRGEAALANGYEDPISEGRAHYDDRKTKRHDRHRDRASQEESEGGLCDDRSFDERVRPGENRVRGESSIGASGRSSRSESITGNTEKRIGRMREVERANEGKPCRRAKEFERCMNAVLKDACAAIESALKRLSKWLSNAKPTAARSSDSPTKPAGEPTEKRSACDAALGFARIDSFFDHPPAGNERPEVILTANPHDPTGASFGKAPEIEEFPTERDEEEPSIGTYATKQAEEEKSDAAPEPEAAPGFRPSNYIAYETATKKAEILADESAAWTEAIPESSTIATQADEEDPTPDAGGIARTNPAGTEGNAVLSNGKHAKDAPAPCKPRNSKRPQFVPPILEALKYGRR